MDILLEKGRNFAERVRGGRVVVDDRPAFLAAENAVVLPKIKFLPVEKLLMYVK
jgi:hypothetical protein